MKMLLLLCAVLGGCAPPHAVRVRCDRHLTPINVSPEPSAGAGSTGPRLGRAGSGSIGSSSAESSGPRSSGAARDAAVALRATPPRSTAP